MEFVRRLFQNHKFQLFVQFARREFLSRYKQSFLGVGWAIVQPLFAMVIFTVIFGQFARIPSDGISYPIFFYTALLPWTLLSTSINTGVNSIVNNISLVTKVYFPREILPFSSIAVAMVDFLIAGVIFGGMAIWYKVDLTRHVIFIIPLVFIQMAVIIAVVLILSVWNVRYRDIRHGLPFLLQCWMYASPIVYPLSMVPEKWRTLYLLNPMAGLIDNYRLILLQGKPLNLYEIIPACVFAVFGLPFAYWYFKRAERSFADII